MKFLLLSIALLFAVGCTHTEKIVTKHVVFQLGTNKLEIANPQDTAWDDLQITHGDSSIRIKKYRSSGNEAAIAAKEQEVMGQTQMFGAYMQFAKDAAATAARAYGIPVPAFPGQPVQADPGVTFRTNTAAGNPAVIWAPAVQK